MKIFNYLITGLITLSALGCANNMTNNVSTNITINKKEYKSLILTVDAPEHFTPQNDFIHMSLANTGTDTIRFEKINYIRKLIYNVSLVDESGKMVPYTDAGKRLFNPSESAQPTEPEISRFTQTDLLPKGKSISDHYHLSEYFFITDGKYTIKVSVKVLTRPGPKESVEIEIPITVTQ
jgi:hypothetical protein